MKFFFDYFFLFHTLGAMASIPLGHISAEQFEQLEKTTRMIIRLFESLSSAVFSALALIANFLFGGIPRRSMALGPVVVFEIRANLENLTAFWDSISIGGIYRLQDALRGSGDRVIEPVFS